MRALHIGNGALALFALGAGCVGRIGDGPLPTTGIAGVSGSGTGTAGVSGSGTGIAGVSGSGTGIAGVSGSGTGTAGTSGAGATVGADLPCDVAALISSKCVTCHGATPLPGVPTSLVSAANLMAPSKSAPTQTNAQLAVTRMMSTTSPMPPAGSTPATSAELAAMQAWIAAGYPTTGCTSGGVADPFAVPATCTSNTTWTGGNQGSTSMDPGKACVSCHQTTGGEAPLFAIAGTLYPTAHEPDLCNGANGTNGARVVITGANGAAITLTPNAAGNFTYQGSVALPFQAKVTYMGRERVMVAAQTSGDCNACHTQTGTMSAPGRIILP